MAATVSLAVGGRAAAPVSVGNRRRSVATVTFDTSYPTGGYAVTASQLGLTSLDALNIFGQSDATGTWLAVWTGSKVKLFSALGTEVSSTTDVHTGSVTVEALGI